MLHLALYIPLDHSAKDTEAQDKYIPTPSRRAMRFFVLVICLIFVQEVLLACILSLSMHIFKAAFYFHSAGDHGFFVGKLYSWIMRKAVITHLKELLTILLRFWRQYKLHRSAELASRITLCLNTWTNLQLV